MFTAEAKSKRWADVVRLAKEYPGRIINCQPQQRWSALHQAAQARDKMWGGDSIRVLEVLCCSKLQVTSTVLYSRLL